MTTAIDVDGISKRFRIYRERNQSLKATILSARRSKFEEFWALDDVSFEIPQGSTFGLMGENGSGKSTLLKCIARIYQPTRGQIRIRGSLAALLELGSGFHPELSGRENVYLNGSILGLSRKDIDRRFDEIVDFSGVERFIDQPVKNYSSGMYVRLAFSVAINVEPDILLVDEVLAVGDASFQEKCMAKFADYKAAGRTVVIVSHGMETMRSLCDEVVWLEHGKARGVGDPNTLVSDYLDAGHDASVHAASGGSRHGTGEGTIDRVEILDGRGRADRAPRTGEAATIRIHWRTTRPIPQPVVGIAVYTNDGQYLFGTNIRDFGLVPDIIDGSGFYDFQIARMPLRPGRYEVVAALTDFSLTHTFDHVRGVAHMDVLHGDDRTSVGPVTTFGEWHTGALSSGRSSERERTA